MIRRACLMSWILVACAVDAPPGLDDDGDDARAGDPGEAMSAAHRVDVAAGTVDDAELITLLPVARSEAAATRRIALQLTPAQLPRLANGDRLITPAEVQVTTRCDVGQIAPGCDYSPTVRAQLIVTGNAGDTAADGASSRAIATQTQSCTKASHHCMFIFDPGEARIELGDLPCIARGDCHVNLVLWAWDPAARAGDQDKILVGGNDGDYLANGRVEGDVARLMAVRERGVTAADRSDRETTGGGSIGVNTNANPVVIYSHRLKPAGESLLRGEQFVIDAKVITDVSGRARFSTQLVLSKQPDGTGGRLEKIGPGQISEQNGKNCLPGDACASRKVAVFRVAEDITDAVYVNVVAKSAVPGGAPSNVTVRRNDGWVRSTRYAARLGQ